jgi:AraC-like DNA-binding protein
VLALKIAEQTIAHSEGDTRSFTTYLRVREVFDKHFLDLKSIEQVAASCNLSVPYLGELFRKFNHLTPYHYLLQKRMEFAADLLSDPKVLVKQIARRLDFADQFQFSRAFKRVFGICPIEFRKSVVSVHREI